MSWDDAPGFSKSPSPFPAVAAHSVTFDSNDDVVVLPKSNALQAAMSSSFTLSFYVSAPPLPAWLPERLLFADAPFGGSHGLSVYLEDRGRVAVILADNAGVYRQVGCMEVGPGCFFHFNAICWGMT